jgi:hypothetical protein
MILIVLPQHCHVQIPPHPNVINSTVIRQFKAACAPYEDLVLAFKTFSHEQFNAVVDSNLHVFTKVRWRCEWDRFIVAVVVSVVFFVVVVVVVVAVVIVIVLEIPQVSHDVG